jgi:hypothetical protein
VQQARERLSPARRGDRPALANYMQEPDVEGFLQTLVVGPAYMKRAVPAAGDPGWPRPMALGLQSSPGAGFTHPQHDAGIEAAFTQCGQRFPRPLQREGHRRVRLQLTLVIESEDLGVASRTCAGRRLR